VGWTPVVGNDTNIEKPEVLPGSVYIDFNQDLKLSRLLARGFLALERRYGESPKCFENLRHGEPSMPWGRPLMGLLTPFREINNSNRLFEVIGCNTREASLQHYNEGLRFWRHPDKHPNNTSLAEAFPHWEHSAGQEAPRKAQAVGGRHSDGPSQFLEGAGLKRDNPQATIA
jgi:hypothetical protein